MTERCALEELVHEAPDCDGVQCAAFSVGVHVLLKILVAVLEDQDELGLCVYDVVESDDVDVLELFHE